MKGAAGCASLNLGHERRRGFHFIESYVQRSETTQAKVFTPDNRLVLDEGHVRSAAGECFEDQLALDARQGRTETEVTGPAESQMTIFCASDVETIRIGKPFRIAIAGCHDRDYSLAFAN
jgi:sarcosine oxidase gamma subunit